MCSGGTGDIYRSPVEFKYKDLKDSNKVSKILIKKTLKNDSNN